MQNQTIIYGAYGSNCHISQMAKRCLGARIIGIGRVRDYHLTFRGSGSGVANIERQKGGEVPVVLWEITKDCEKALDRYEGYPILYVKSHIEVETEQGARKAMFYVMAKEYESNPVLPNDYYFNVIRHGYEQNGLPLEYLERALEECRKEIEKQRRDIYG